MKLHYAVTIVLQITLQHLFSIPGAHTVQKNSDEVLQED